MMKKLLIGLPLFLLLLVATPFLAQAHDLGCGPSHDACRSSCIQVLTDVGYSAAVACYDSCEPPFKQCERAGPFTSCLDQDQHCFTSCLYLASFHPLDLYPACNAECKVLSDSCQESQFQPTAPVSKPVDVTPVKLEAKTITEKAQQRKDMEKIGKPFATTMEFGKDIKAGDTVKAGKRETVTATFPDGSKIIMKPSSSMKFISEELMDFIKGKYEIFLKTLQDKVRKKIEVRTPSAVLAERGTEYSLDVTSFKTLVRVYDGIVDVSDKDGKNTVEVKAGTQVTVTKAKVGKVKKILSSLVKRWNAQNAQAK